MSNQLAISNQVDSLISQNQIISFSKIDLICLDLSIYHKLQQIHQISQFFQVQNVIFYTKLWKSMTFHYCGMIFGKKLLIVWHLGQKYDICQEVWQLPCLWTSVVVLLIQNKILFSDKKSSLWKFCWFVQLNSLKAALKQYCANRYVLHYYYWEMCEINPQFLTKLDYTDFWIIGFYVLQCSF